MNCRRNFAWIAVFSTLAFGFGSAYAQNDSDFFRNRRLQRPDGLRARINWAADEQRQADEYWIGIGGKSVDAALAAHLGLDENEGVIVNDVVENSPAAKGDLKKHDVIVKIGDAKISGIADVQKAVKEHEGTEMSVTVIRAGKELTVEITPEFRPERFKDSREAPEGALNFGPWMPKSPEEAWSMRFFGPGVITFGNERAEFPAGLSIAIKKDSDKPAKITVKRGDDSWEASEDELDKLPEDVRRHVERLLGRLPAPVFEKLPMQGRRELGSGGRFRWDNFDEGRDVLKRFFGRDQDFEVREFAPGSDGQSDRLQRRLENMSQRMERLMEEFRDLRNEVGNEDGSNSEVEDSDATSEEEAETESNFNSPTKSSAEVNRI